MHLRRRSARLQKTRPDYPRLQWRPTTRQGLLFTKPRRRTALVEVLGASRLGVAAVRFGQRLGLGLRHRLLITDLAANTLLPPQTDHDDGADQ